MAILSDGPPVLLNVASAPTFADAQAAITWSSGVTTGIKTDVNLKNLIGRGSGESVQMSFPGQGWVLVQPSEGQVAGAVAQQRQRRRPRRPAQPVVRPVDVHELLGVGVVDDDLARRAVPARLERAAAGVVAVRLGAGRARAPVGQQPQRAGQLAARLRELVREPRRALGVGLRDHQRLLGQVFSRALSTLGAIPSSSSWSSLKRLGPSSSAATTSSVQRSPTRSSASASGSDGTRLARPTRTSA